MSVALGIISRTLLGFPMLFYILVLPVVLIVSLWKYRFLYFAVFILAAVNFDIHLPEEMTFGERAVVCTGIVLGEDPYEYHARLRIQVDKILFANDTIACSFPVDCYVHEKGPFLGKRLTIKGRIKPAKRTYRPAVLAGKIIGSAEHEHVFGVIFGPIRSYIDHLLRNSFDGDRYGVASGLTLGGSGRLSRELKEVFSRAGILHVLAVSGLHVGFVGAFFGVMLLLVPVDHRVKFIMVMCGLFMYAGVTGFRPSVCRAVLMSFLFGLALVSQRNVDSMHVVNMSALVFLLVSPVLLFDVGAQLSFVAVYGILYLFPVLEDNFIKKVQKRFLRVVLRMMAVSFSAQVFVAPLLMYYFNRLPIYAVVANLLIVPIASVLIFMLFLCFSVGWVWFGVVRIIAVPTGILIGLLMALSDFFARLPFSTLNLSMSPMMIFPFYLLAWKRVRKLMLWLVVFFAVIFSIAGSVRCLTVCSTSGGLLIITPDNTHIYVTDKITAEQGAFLHKQGIDTLDYLIARSKSYPVKREFIRCPGNLSFLELKYGDLEILFSEQVAIRFGECTMVYSQHYFDRQPGDGKITYVFSNGKVNYVVERSLYDTIFEQTIFDLRILICRLRLLCQ